MVIIDANKQYWLYQRSNKRSKNSPHYIDFVLFHSNNLHFACRQPFHLNQPMVVLWPNFQCSIQLTIKRNERYGHWACRMWAYEWAWRAEKEWKKWNSNWVIVLRCEWKWRWKENCWMSVGQWNAEGNVIVLFTSTTTKNNDYPSLNHCTKVMLTSRPSTIVCSRFILNIVNITTRNAKRKIMNFNLNLVHRCWWKPRKYKWKICWPRKPLQSTAKRKVKTPLNVS